MPPAPVIVVDHPLVQHKLTVLRRKDTNSAHFRAVCSEISQLLAYEVTRDLPLSHEAIETPVAPMQAPVMRDVELVLISILRAGNGLVDGMLKLLPMARVGHIGLYRDPKTLQAVEYYFKVPPDMPRRDAILVDPMLATGHSSVAAVERVRETHPRSIKFLCLLAAPEGVRHFQKHCPDVPVYTAAIDEHLNEKKYIVPGLGDAGDRMFGTQ